MGYYTLCAKCKKEIGYSDFRFALPNDGFVCYDCLEKLEDIISKWLEEK